MEKAEKNRHDHLILIGLITKPHGISGEVKIKPLTDFPDRFKNLNHVFLLLKEEVCEDFAIESVRVMQGNAVFIKFAGIDSAEEAKKLVGSQLAVERADCVELPSDHYYVFDLIGMNVVLCHGELIGSIVDVVSNTAQDILIVETNSGNRVMVPFVKQIVPQVQLAEHKVVVNNLPGLFDEVEQ